MERNVAKMIDLTQFMLMESSGDSEVKSDRHMGSLPICYRTLLSESDDNGDDDDNDDDAQSCSYGSSHVDGLCHDYLDKKNVYQDDDDDDDEGDDDAIDSTMVEISKKCGAWQEKRDCSKTKLLNEKENDKDFWETCLAS